MNAVNEDEEELNKSTQNEIKYARDTWDEDLKF